MRAEQKETVLRVLELTRNVARAHRGLDLRKRSAGVLLVARDETFEKDIPAPASSSSSSSGRKVCDVAAAYMICQVSLSPLELCLWECAVIPASESVACHGTSCPTAMTLELQWVKHSGASGGGERAQHCPRILTAHHFAWEFRSEHLPSLRFKLVFQDYEVTSLSTIRLSLSADTFQTGDFLSVLGYEPAKGCLDEHDDDDAGHDSGDDQLGFSLSLLQCLEKQPALNEQQNREGRKRKINNDSFAEPTLGSLKKRARRRARAGMCCLRRVNHIISYPILSYHIISYHIISYHIISYHIISYHIISYHIISYHII